MMKVLLVDDSKSARFALKAVLKKRNLDIEMAESGEQALEYLSKNLVDLVFMDHSMPGMSGVEATQAIKQNPATKAIPVVLCTSNEGAEYEKNARDAGAIGVLSKPPKPAMLDSILAQIAEQSAPAAATGLSEHDVVSLLNQRLEADYSEQQLLERMAPAINSAVSALVTKEVETVLAQMLEQTVKPMIRQQIGDLDAQIRDAISSAGDSEELQRLEARLKTDLVTHQNTVLAMIDSNSSAEQVTPEQFNQLQDSVERLNDQLDELPDDLKKSIGDGVSADTDRVVNAGIASMKTYVNDQRAGDNDELMSRVNGLISNMEAGLNKKVYIVAGFLSLGVIAAIVLSFL